MFWVYSEVGRGLGLCYNLIVFMWVDLTAGQGPLVKCELVPVFNPNAVISDLWQGALNHPLFGEGQSSY